MKTLLSVVLALIAVPAFAQPKGAAVGSEVEALVTVVKVDKAKRSVVFRGPRGNEVEMQVPPEAPNFDKVKPGHVFAVKYAEAMAVSITRGGGAPAVSEQQQVNVGKKGGTPGGSAIRTRQVSAVIDAIDYKTRHVAVRGPDRNVIAMQVADDVNLSELKPGDTITVSYTQALALQMVEQPGKPAAKKAEKKS